MTTTLLETAPTVGIDRSAAAEASSAHSRVNIPLNLNNWKPLPPAIQQDLLWFHQHVLDEHLGWKDCTEAIGYDQSTVFRVLKGTYEGSYPNVCAKIRSYRKLHEARGTIQQNEFVENSLTKLICAGLDYAMANNSITLISGESRMGKSLTVNVWQQLNNHGRTVLVTAPAYGGTKALLREIAERVGVNRSQPTVQIHESILRAFNRNRMLIVDEAHRLLPGDRRSNPVNLEIIRDIHDRTGCAVALIATERFESALTHSRYMFEQLIGRIGMPIRLKPAIKPADITPIIEQYVEDPSEELMNACLQTANEPGRLGLLVEKLKLASRIAGKGRTQITEQHAFKAFALHAQMASPTLKQVKR